MEALDEAQERLERSLERLIALVEANDANDFWAGKLRTVTDRIANGAEGSLEDLGNYFGGMGSLSDLSLTGRPDRPLSETEQRNANRRFQHLADEVYDAMEDVKRELRKL